MHYTVFHYFAILLVGVGSLKLVLKLVPKNTFVDVGFPSPGYNTKNELRYHLNIMTL